MQEQLHHSSETAGLLRSLRAFLSRRRVTAYLVGGVVRDALIGRPTHDIDLAVSGDPVRLAETLATELGGGWVALDQVHQIARVVLSRGQDKRDSWFVDLAALRGAVAEDLAERDFTIDAMAIDLFDPDLLQGRGAVIDPFGGRSDLRDGSVRAVNPDIFKADPARLIRAVRLSAELGFSIESGTASQVKHDAHLLSLVSPERVRDELWRILAAQNATRRLRTLDELGLLTIVIPELEDARGVQQPREHYWDVLNHLLETVGAVERALGDGRKNAGKLSTDIPWDSTLEEHFAEEVSVGRNRLVLLKLAALLHDIGKPETKTIEPSGRMRFIGHPKLGAEKAIAIMERLRFSNRETRMVSTMVEQHLRPSLINRGEEGPTDRAVYRYYRDCGDVAIDTIFLSLADYMAARGPMLEQAEDSSELLQDWRDSVAKRAYLLNAGREKQEVVSPPKLLTGDDLVNQFGLTPGPLFKQLLEAVREALAAGEIATKDEALALVRKVLAESDQRSEGRGNSLAQ